MRRLALAATMAGALAGPLSAQLGLITGALPDSAVSAYQVDFAIPPAPAAQLLRIDESSLHRPGTARALAASFGGFTADGGFSVPEAYAVEFSPYLMAAGTTLTLREYRTSPGRRFLSRLRISGATGPAGLEDDRRAVSFGGRLTVFDGADLRQDSVFLDSVQVVTAPIQEHLDSLREEAGAPIVCTNPLDRSSCTRRDIVLAIDPVILDAARDSVEALHDRYTARRWNAPVMEIAYASRAAGVDDAGNGLRMDRHALWATAGWGFGSWGQVLAGTRLASERFGADWLSRATAGLRLFAGENQRKAFVEVEGTATDGRKPGWAILSGVEARLHSLAWVSAAAGSRWGVVDEDSRLTARFDLSVALPEYGFR